MKIFIARVEQHTYPIIEDHWTNVKAFIEEFFNELG